mgnify:FL=1
MEERKTHDNLSQWKGEYSESKFHRTIKKVAKTAGQRVVYYAMVLYYTLKSSDVSVANKSIIMGALGYLILPTDLIPDFIPLLGFTDDLTALLACYNTIKISLTPEIKLQAERKVCELFGVCDVKE